MARNELWSQNSLESTNEGTHRNVTGQDSGTRRGQHVMEVPSTLIQAVTPTDNTDLDFPHRYIYAGGAGNINIQFEAGTGADTFTLAVPAGALLPLEVYSINSTSTTATGLFLFR